MLRRRLAQWGNDSPMGLVGLVDVLPPELQIHLANLAPDTRTLPSASSVDIIQSNKYGQVIHNPLNIQVISSLILRSSSSRRTFLSISNSHPTNSMFVRFGADSDITSGQQLFPNGGTMFFDDFIPQDDIYIIANGANTNGLMMYSNKE